MSTSPETSGESKKISGLRNKLGGGVAIAALIASTGGGAKLAYNAVRNEERSEDQSRKAEAAGYKRCINLSHSQSVLRRENGRAIVRLTGLSAQQKADCDLDRVEGDLNGWGGSIRTGVFLPLDAEIVKPSVEVKLPSEQALQDSAEEELSRANNGMTVLDGATKYSVAGMGAIIGGGVLLIGAGGVGAAVGRLRG